MHASHLSLHRAGSVCRGCWLRSPPKPSPPRCVCAHSGWILVLSSTKLGSSGAEGSRAQISGRAVTSSVCRELAAALPGTRHGHGHGRTAPVLGSKGWSCHLPDVCVLTPHVKFADTWYPTSDFQQRWWLSCFLLFLSHTLHLQMPAQEMPPCSASPSSPCVIRVHSHRHFVDNTQEDRNTIPKGCLALPVALSVQIFPYFLLNGTWGQP